MSKNEDEEEFKYYIDTFKMIPHPEGGHFVQIFKSNSKVETIEKQSRTACTFIYFLLHHKETSYWHQLKSDEIWHFYSGSTLIIHTFDEFTKEQKDFYLGNKTLDKKNEFMVVISAGLWFGASVFDKNAFSFVGCTVAPGFEYEDFKLAERNDFELKYPQLNGIL